MEVELLAASASSPAVAERKNTRGCETREREVVEGETNLRAWAAGVARGAEEWRRSKGTRRSACCRRTSPEALGLRPCRRNAKPVGKNLVGA